MTKKEKQYFEQQLDESLKYGFIHNVKYKNNIYSPKVLVNNPKTGEYILNTLQSELKKSDSFCISVAFVTTAGISMLKTQLLDFAKRGGRGKILVSPYMDFNDPEALFELLKLKNVEVRLTPDELKMHAKFYIFNHQTEQTVIVGSSNLTHSALKLNYEWNVKLTSADNGDFIQRTQEDFDNLWEVSTVLTEEVVEEYAKNRKRPVPLVEETELSKDEQYLIVKPNKMQEAAVKSIQSLRNKGANRALVISATGTGKTYLGAFDVKEAMPERMLFLVHREQILRDAEYSFRQVIGYLEKEAMIYKSGDEIKGKKFVFATVQTFSRDENLQRFAADEFDYILIDEVHHAAANSYQKIMNHFTPEFYLGLTATPERTDGQNIYELFDYNVAYEIRLQEALEEEMLAPFIYYGVAEFQDEDGELIDEKTTFSHLVTSERVEHLIEKIKYYEVSQQQTKGLIFCSRNAEAVELSEALNQRGFKTVALSGKDSQEVREARVAELEAGDLDYILTVDIFNEGIDIPSVNQVVMLRNTESSIVFVQQLGRGLRLHPEKDFVTVIDFIGNYKNNYLIPIALYGDQSLNKDNYRRHLGNPQQIEGLTTINFEEIAQQQIFQSIAKTTMSSIANLKNNYLELVNRIGRTPFLFDYIRNKSIDPIVFFEGRFKHYGEVIDKFEKGKEEYLLEGVKADGILQMMSYELLNGKRPHELLLLKLLFIEKGRVSKERYLDYLSEKGAEHSDELIQSVERIMTLEFFGQQSKKKYKYPLIEIVDGKYSLSPVFVEGLHQFTFRELVVDVIKAGLARSRKYPAGYQVKGLEIGEKYTRKDVMRLLLWEKDESSTVYGYRTKHGTTPIFINYHKSEEISATTQYNDTFINEHLLHWYSKSNRTLESPEVQKIIHSAETENELHLFVKRDDGDGTDFYYLGQIDYNEGTATNHTIGEVGNEEPVVTMDFTLRTPMSYELFHYLVRED